MRFGYLIQFEPIESVIQLLDANRPNEAKKNRIEAQGCDIVAGSPDQCRQFLASETEKWGAVIHQHNITADS